MNLVDEWMESKKKTYWKIWKADSGDYSEGTYQWVLFYTEEIEGVNSTYEVGLSGSKKECEEEIRKAIRIRLETLNLL